MSTFDKIVWAGVVILLIPVLLSPAGWAIGLIAVVGWLALTYGGREAWEMEKSRREGERGMIKDVRRRSRRGEE